MPEIKVKVHERHVNHAINLCTSYICPEWAIIGVFNKSVIFFTQNEMFLFTLLAQYDNSTDKSACTRCTPLNGQTCLSKYSYYSLHYNYTKKLSNI